MVFDSYATGDGSRARVSVVNHTADVHEDLRAPVRTYDLDGRLRDVRWADGIGVAPGASVRALTISGYSIRYVRTVRADVTRRRGARRERLLAIAST